MNYEHTPVLLAEVIRYLSPGSGESFVDATLGGGGYTKAILYANSPDGKVLAIDLDQDAIENFANHIKQPIHRLTTQQGNFSQIDKIINHHKFPAPNGIVADLGLSSYELEHRGISFQTDQPLDMRFNLSQPETAKFILESYDEKRLEKIFREYGEEKFSRQIAKRIIGYRAQGIVLKHTTDLYKLIKEALPKPVKHKADDSARRIFQALRIEVNHELDSLQEFLPRAFDILAPGGRLVVVSFHSLEDRIVKQFFVGLSKGCVCPLDFPQCVCGKNPRGKILTKKPVMASEAELARNPRSRPAKLRAVVKL